MHAFTHRLTDKPAWRSMIVLSVCSPPLSCVCDVYVFRSEIVWGREREREREREVLVPEYVYASITVQAPAIIIVFSYNNNYYILVVTNTVI
jgi:hypothetical protein